MWRTNTSTCTIFADRHQRQQYGARRNDGADPMGRQVSRPRPPAGARSSTALCATESLASFLFRTSVRPGGLRAFGGQPAATA